MACSVILSDSRENYLKRRNLFKMSSWIKLEGGNFPTFLSGLVCQFYDFERVLFDVQMECNYQVVRVVFDV